MILPVRWSVETVAKSEPAAANKVEKGFPALAQAVEVVVNGIPTELVSFSGIKIEEVTKIDTEDRWDRLKAKLQAAANRNIQNMDIALKIMVGLEKEND